MTSPFYGPKIWYADDPDGEWEQADGVALPEGGDAALERIWVIVPGEADGTVYAGGDPGVLFESRDGGASVRRSTGACGSIPAGERWQPGAGGLCLHSIVDLARRAGPARHRHLRRRRVADRRRRRDVAQRQRGHRRALPARGRRPTTRSRSACTACSARRPRPERMLHAVPRRRLPLRRRGRDVDGHRRRACRRTSASRSRSIPPTPTAPT